MKFESFTYKHNPQKVKEDNRDSLYIAAGILLFIIVFFFLFRGVIGLLMFAALSYTLIQLKIKDNNKKGANRFGSLVERLTLTSESLTIGTKHFNIDDVSNFKISANDVLGTSSGLLGNSAGVDNFLEFTHAGTNHSFQFQIRKMSDLQLLNELGKSINATLAGKKI